MATKKEISILLEKEKLTTQNVNAIWNFMIERNWKVKNLADSGKSWTDLNIHAIQSLIKEYDKELKKFNDEI